MASSKNYLNYILESLSDLPDISYRPMMGEYVLYYRGKVFGGIYDDRLLVKLVPSALSYLKNPIFDFPYEGAKQMILVDELEDKVFLSGLIKAVFKDLPTVKEKKK